MTAAGAKSAHKAAGGDVDRHAAVERERKAYEIPPSRGDEEYHGAGGWTKRSPLPHADSDLSSVGSVYWDDDASELSPAAETLFKKLGGQAKQDRDRRNYQVRW